MYALMLFVLLIATGVNGALQRDKQRPQLAEFTGTRHKVAGTCAAA